MTKTQKEVIQEDSASNFCKIEFSTFSVGLQLRCSLLKRGNITLTASVNQKIQTHRTFVFKNRTMFRHRVINTYLNFLAEKRGIKENNQQWLLF